MIRYTVRSCVVHLKNCNLLLAVDMADVACRGLWCACGQMSKDIGMEVRNLPCLVALWGFHPYMPFHFFL